MTSDCTMTTLILSLNSKLADLSSTSNSSSVLPNCLRLHVALTTSVAVIRAMVSFEHDIDKWLAQDTPEIPPPIITKAQLNILGDIFTNLSDNQRSSSLALVHTSYKKHEIAAQGAHCTHRVIRHVHILFNSIQVQVYLPHD